MDEGREGKPRQGGVVSGVIKDSWSWKAGALQNTRQKAGNLMRGLIVRALLARDRYLGGWSSAHLCPVVVKHWAKPARNTLGGGECVRFACRFESSTVGWLSPAALDKLRHATHKFRKGWAS